MSRNSYKLEKRARSRPMAAATEDCGQFDPNRPGDGKTGDGKTGGSASERPVGDARQGESLHRLGMTAFQEGNLETAVELLGLAIAGAGGTRPECSNIHSDLGMALQSQGKVEEALCCYERAIALKPESGVAWSNRGLALESLGRLEEAGASLARAAESRPGLAVILSNLGNVLQKQGRLAESEESHRRALRAEPGNTAAWSNLAGVLELEGRLAEAEECYSRALALKPDFGVARFNRSLLRLLRGDLAAGLPDYEERVRMGRPRVFARPQWRGEELKGARILLWCEQGLGDSVQFLRYVPLVQAAGGQVVLEVPAALGRLAAELPGLGADDVRVAGEPLPGFDWHCPLMSLPLALGTTLNRIPADAPYFSIPVAAARRAAARAWPPVGLRVGLAWAGNAKHSRDRYRSIPLKMLSPLLEVAGACFFSLQVGSAGRCEDEAWIAGQITDLAPAIDDLADTAALLRHLDVVIAVDTVLAHLAGALAVPVWLLLPAAPDWRWLLGREDSPWYPAMRLFRQVRLGQWGGVVERVRGLLVRAVEEQEIGVRE